MKNFIQVLVLSTIFLFISCSVEKDEFSSYEKKNIIIEKTYKALEVSHNGTIKTTDIEWLKAELNVQQTISLTKNKLVWLMYNRLSIADINELILFADEVSSVKEVNAIELDNYIKAVDDTVGDGDTEGDIEKGDDTVGDGDTEGDIEKGDDTVGDGDTEGDIE